MPLLLLVAALGRLFSLIHLSVPSHLFPPSVRVPGSFLSSVPDSNIPAMSGSEGGLQLPTAK